MGMRSLILAVGVIFVQISTASGCPTGCECKEIIVGFQSPSSVNCSNLSLTDIPYTLSDSRTEILRLTHNKITKLTNSSFVNMIRLIIIDLEDNQISEVQAGTFRWLYKLLIIDLSRNNISHLHPRTFTDNHLKLLDLSYNPLIIPSDVSFLITSAFFNLGLVACNLTHIPDTTFDTMRGLLSVNLSYNNLNTLNLSVFGHLSYMRLLAIRYNSEPLTIEGTMPKSISVTDFSGTMLNIKSASIFSHHNRIETLLLDDCNLTEFSAEFFDNTALVEELHLNNNNIKVLNISIIRGFPLLRSLHLKNNSIHYIEPDIFSKTPLRNLSLSNNPINLPDRGSFLNVPTLLTLALKSCAITNLRNETFHGTKSLIFLDLSYNEIKQITDDVFSELESLSVLLLENNYITVIEKNAFLHNVKLIALNLSGNPLIIPSNAQFLSAPSLQLLHLKSCGISHLGIQTFSHSLHLRVLDISQNKLKFLDAEMFSKMKHLQSLNILENPLVCDYQIRPLWLLCLDRDMECNGTCGQDSWNILEDVTQPQETMNHSHALPQEEQLEIHHRGTESGVPITVMILLAVGFLIGTIVGVVSSVFFCQKYFGTFQRENSVYHSVADESITTQSLQQLYIENSE